jgi:hypothetical protein
MTYDQAKRKILINRLLGIPIIVIASLSSTISALKMFYFGLDSADPISSSITRVVKQLVYLAYDHTRFLEFFWVHSPTPTPRELFSSSNLAVFIIYLGVFMGLSLTGSARALAFRLKEIDKAIENQLIMESIQGNAPRKRREIQKQTPISKEGWFSKFHSLYLAPIIVGLVVLVIAKITGLV